MAVQITYKIFTTSSNVGGTIYTFGNAQDIIRINIAGNDYETEDEAKNALEGLDDRTLQHREFIILPIYRIIE